MVDRRPDQRARLLRMSAAVAMHLGRKTKRVGRVPRGFTLSAFKQFSFLTFHLFKFILFFPLLVSGFNPLKVIKLV